MRTHRRIEKKLLKNGRTVKVEVATLVIRRVRMKIIIAGQHTERFQQCAKPNFYYKSLDVEKILHAMAEHLEQKYPKLEFRMVQVSHEDFNFIATGEKEEGNAEAIHNDTIAQGSSGQN